MLQDMNKMIFDEMKLLQSVSGDDIKTEVARANAQASSACTIIKNINAQLSIKNAAQQLAVTEESLKKELGINDKK